MDQYARLSFRYFSDDLITSGCTVSKHNLFDTLLLSHLNVYFVSPLILSRIRPLSTVIVPLNSNLRTGSLDDSVSLTAIGKRKPVLLL